MPDFVRSRNTEDGWNPTVDALKPAPGAKLSDAGKSDTTTLHPAHGSWLTAHGSRLTTVDVHRCHTTQHRRHFQTGAITVSREP